MKIVPRTFPTTECYSQQKLFNFDEEEKFAGYSCSPSISRIAWEMLDIHSALLNWLIGADLEIKQPYEKFEESAYWTRIKRVNIFCKLFVVYRSPCDTAIIKHDNILIFFPRTKNYNWEKKQWKPWFTFQGHIWAKRKLHLLYHIITIGCSISGCNF